MEEWNIEGVGVVIVVDQHAVKLINNLWNVLTAVAFGAIDTTMIGCQYTRPWIIRKNLISRRVVAVLGIDWRNLDLLWVWLDALGITIHGCLDHCKHFVICFVNSIDEGTVWMFDITIFGQVPARDDGFAIFTSTDEIEFVNLDKISHCEIGEVVVWIGVCWVWVWVWGYGCVG